MAELITVRDLPPDFELALSGDWHCGARAFHEAALDRLIEWILAAPNRFLGFSGDLIEGKTIDSPHFDPASLREGQTLIGMQLEWACEKIRPIAERILWLGLGNHDRYVKDADLVRALVAKPLGILDRLGGYQTWIDLGWFKVHHWHGWASIPRGAKDPIQKEANQRAWLVNRLAPLAGDCALHVMGHVHQLLVQPPLNSYALLTKEGEVRARYFIEPTQEVVTYDQDGNADTRSFIPRTSRWYVCSGTLRRSGGFGWTDYAEVAGYPPAEIGWMVAHVKGGVISDIEKVVV